MLVIDEVTHHSASQGTHYSLRLAKLKRVNSKNGRLYMESKMEDEVEIYGANKKAALLALLNRFPLKLCLIDNGTSFLAVQVDVDETIENKLISLAKALKNSICKLSMRHSAVQSFMENPTIENLERALSILALTNA